jgi:hypothetical protein
MTWRIFTLRMEGSLFFTTIWKLHRINERGCIQGCQMVYLFSYQNNQFWHSLVRLGIETVGIFWMSTWNILRTFSVFYILQFGTFCVHLVYFTKVLVCSSKENLATRGCIVRRKFLAGKWAKMSRKLGTTQKVKLAFIFNPKKTDATCEIQTHKFQNFSKLFLGKNIFGWKYFVVITQNT